MLLVTERSLFHCLKKFDDFYQSWWLVRTFQPRILIYIGWNFVNHYWGVYIQYIKLDRFRVGPDNQILQLKNSVCPYKHQHICPYVVRSSICKMYESILTYCYRTKNLIYHACLSVCLKGFLLLNIRSIWRISYRVSGLTLVRLNIRILSIELLCLQICWILGTNYWQL